MNCVESPHTFWHVLLGLLDCMKLSSPVKPNCKVAPWGMRRSLNVVVAHHMLLLPLTGTLLIIHYVVWDTKTYPYQLPIFYLLHDSFDTVFGKGGVWGKIQVWTHQSETNSYRMRLVQVLLSVKFKFELQAFNPLTTDDECTHHETLAACYQLAECVLKIGFVQAKMVG